MTVQIGGGAALSISGAWWSLQLWPRRLCSWGLTDMWFDGEVKIFGLGPLLRVVWEPGLRT